MADETTQRAEDLLPVVNEAAASVSKRLFTFLTVAVYVAITVAATTDEMLLRGTQVKLPLLDTEIPISGLFGFYTVAPWLLVLLHCDLLMQVNVLATKLFRFQERAAQLTALEQGRLSDRLASFHYVQFFLRAGSTRLVRAVPGLVLVATVVALPLLLLCWTQLRFSVLHDPVVTWSQRLALATDLGAILLVLWPALARRDGIGAPDDRERPRSAVPNLISVRMAVATTCVLIAALSIAGSIPTKRPGAGFWSGLRRLNLREAVLTPDKLSAEAINALLEGPVAKRESQLAQVSRRSVLQGRNLSDANLYAAVLPRADLRAMRIGDDSWETRLTNADMRWAQMQQVLLDDADLHHASLDGAHLQGASLVRANLRRATLIGAELQDAKLNDASLRRAALQRAQLQGADLSRADLRAADLSGADLTGAILRGAQLEGAILDGTVLDGAELSEARLDDANLRHAQLRATAFDGATLDGVRLEHATLCLTPVREVRDQTNSPARWQPAAASAADAPGPSGDGDTAEYLRKLACEDEYVARGIVAQALSSKDSSRQALAAALVSPPPASCAGLLALPGHIRDALQKRATEGDRGAACVAGAAPPIQTARRKN